MPFIFMDNGYINCVIILILIIPIKVMFVNL